MKTKVFIAKEQIQNRIRELAEQIKHDYEGKEVVLIGVLDGSFIFLADFVRALWNAGCTTVSVEFIGVSSYQGTQTSKKPVITKHLKSQVSDKHVLIVEDIADTGYTLQFLQEYLSEKKPSSLHTLVLLSKPSKREVEVALTYVGFEIENRWVVGYGFDTDGWGRGMNEIHEKIE